MTLLQAFILGVVQGLTEFLPISSSAHLVLLPWALNWQLDPDQAFVFNVLVQVGTIVSVIAYFWRDLWMIARDGVLGLLRRTPFFSHEARLGWYIVLATLPAGLVGVLLKDFFQSVFENPTWVSALLLVTALLLVLAERLSTHQRLLDTLDWKDALLMGLFQALAILPGVSRSGSTITGGMLRQLSRPAAARFSFLMAVPIMLAAGLLALLDLTEVSVAGGFIPAVLVGFVTAAVVGWLSIHWLLRFVASHRLYGFAVYCAVVGLGGLLLSLWRG